MRNLHLHLKEEFGEESVFLLQQWEKIEKKMVDFRNHRRFSLKCLSFGVIPVSIRLKTNVRTARGIEIIKKTERKLLNECIRSINNTIEMYMYERESLVLQFEEKLEKNNQEILEECHNFIKRVVESRHNRVMTWQKRKFELLVQQKTGGRSNKTKGDVFTGAKTSEASTNTSKWVRNLSDKPLTQAQRSLLAQGPNYAVIPRVPPKEEYIAAIEQACHKLEEGKVDELRVEVKHLLKKAITPRSYISKEEVQAIQELKRDGSRIILTADKGVAMVVLNKEDYIQKAKHLLNQPTYKKMKEDPTSKQKARLIKLPRNIKADRGHHRRAV